MSLFDAHRRDLEAIAADNRLRALMPRRGIDFASNDYLGFAGKSLLRDAAENALAAGVSLGSKGSRLLGGNDPAHEALEAYAADLFRTEAALFVSSGFAANSAVISTLPQKGDLVLYDALIHASVHEGLKLTRADRRIFLHNDPEAAAQAIRDWRAKGGNGQVWIAIESLYSMDGDLADLAGFHALAEASESVLVVDEAHAMGVLGPRGLGLADPGAGAKAPDYLIRIVTCGKALGCEGALILGPEIMRDYLVNRGRGFIFSTAPSPLMAAVAKAALEKIATEPQHREQLARLTSLAHASLPDRFTTPSQQSPILPVIIGDNGRTMEIADALQDAGFDVRGIRPPTVPAGTSRLRITITNNVSEADISGLFAKLAELG